MSLRCFLILRWVFILGWRSIRGKYANWSFSKTDKSAYLDGCALGLGILAKLQERIQIIHCLSIEFSYIEAISVFSSKFFQTS